MNSVVIVESPAKAKTIDKYLGRGYHVLASFGHVRDLPAKDGSVDPEDDFAMRWAIDTKASKRLSDIANAVKDADRVILATDPDREGEAISWHVLEVLKNKKVLKDKQIERVVFNAITKTAILEAMRHPREIDTALVEAYLARRALDYLVGFNLSPVLWRKLPGARSAGRVQSVSLRLVCERELEIEKFVPREYWSITAHLNTKEKAPVTARLTGADGQRLQRLDVGTGEEAAGLKSALDAADFTIKSVEAKPAKRHPAAPFTTSTLQQEASRKLGLAPAMTMRIAQRLYEGIDIGGETVGLITYMRTDGVDIAPEAIASMRDIIGKDYGAKYVPGAPRKYVTKQKNAQEAHEAIRPTDITRLPRHVAKMLDKDQARLYELIWTRTLASQMESAELERTTVDIEAAVPAGQKYKTIDLRTTGQVVRFDGFLVLYQEGKDDEEDEDSGRLPPMTEGDPLAREKIETAQHFTEPPPRFTEATLVKRMEELGIGRPSTYASTLAVLRDRDYIRIEKKRIVPEDKGRLVTAFLESFFTRYVQYDFTADLEEKLDKVSNSEADWKQLLRDFWTEFSASVDSTKELRTTEVLDNLNEVLGAHVFPAREDGSDPRSCQACADGRLSLKVGKFGAFIGCSNYPECKFTRTLSGGNSGDDGSAGPRLLGSHPETGDEVTLRDGRFGPYIQLGEEAKPKRSSLPRGLEKDDVTLEKALALLALPREVAKHPASGEPILAGLGRYGPYVQHQKMYASLGRDDDVLEIGANRAIDLIITKEQGGGGRGGNSVPARIIGTHPDGGDIGLKSGRFGPYVTWNKVNATLPRDKDPESITLEEAVVMIAAKQETNKAAQGRELGEHPEGGMITVRDGRFGPYVNVNKVNATIPKDMTIDAITLQDAIDLIDEKGGPGKPAAKKGAARKGAAKKAAKKPAKKAAAKKKPAKKAAAKSQRQRNHLPKRRPPQKRLRRKSRLANTKSRRSKAFLSNGVTG